MWRWIGFILAIMVGLGGGLLYGWVIDPVEYVDTSLSSLRIDYQSDYVLMVAEAYRADSNLALAVQRLASLGEVQPLESVHQAQAFAGQHGYAASDLEALGNLENALNRWNPILETTQP